MPIQKNYTINHNRVFVCVKEDNKLVTKPADVFGAERVISGQADQQTKIAQQIYDLLQQQHKSCIKVELLTGGEYLNEFDGYKNWFPGSTTFGFIREHDTNIVDENRNQLFDENNNALYVPMYSGPVSKQQATVEILDILDGALVDPLLKAYWYYHIRTATGIVGYIPASAVSDIFYKVKS